ncbi:SDR family NAD(P)-dependent oxidoreductase [Haloplanus litoreus]|uniref:SDR family NAD(P)-dependent oxidoreductase n=1 Tax=Haloplanus litoreus TaxID=767515 RepID=UPI00360DEBFF
MSAVSMSKYAVPYIRECGGGSILNVSSATALRPKRDGSSAPYTTTKSAMMGLTRAMARDHGGDRIRVNCLLPGLIWTPGIARHLADEREKRNEATPYALEGSPWDVGWTAVFLASERARFITGAAIPVDGGSCSRQPTTRLGCDGSRTLLSAAATVCGRLTNTPDHRSGDTD